MKRHMAAIIAAIMLALPACAAGVDEISIPVVEYDLGEWEQLYNSLSEESRQALGNRGIKELFRIYREGGGGAIDAKGVQRAIGVQIKNRLKMLVKLVAAAFLCMAVEIVVGDGKKGVSELLLFCITGVCLSGITVSVCEQFKSAMAAVDGISAVTEAASPVLITLISACGAINVSGSVQPAMILLCTGITGLFKSVLMPLTLLMCGFSAASCVTGQKQLKSFAGLIKTILKWTMGACFTFFLGSVSMRCLNAGSLDSVGIKTLKYAFDKSIPIVGGVISGTYESLRAGAVALKNAAGTVAVLIGAASAIGPAANMLSMIIALKVLSALCAASSEGRISGMLDGAAESCTYMFAVAATVTVMNLLMIVGALLASGAGG